MKALSALVAFSLTAVASLSFAVEGAKTQCLSDSQARSVLQDFKVMQWNLRAGKFKEVQKISSCEDGSVSFKLARAYNFISQLSRVSSSPLVPSVIANEGARGYFRNRIREIYLESENSSEVCGSGTTVAYVMTAEKNIMHICPFALEVYDSDVAAASILMHEARHIDGYGHVECSHGMMRGNGFSCDDRFSDQGSYGVGTSFLLDVYQSTSNPLLRQETRSGAVVDLTERFNELPLDLKSHVLLHRQDQGASVFDGKTIKDLSSLKARILTMYGSQAEAYTNEGRAFGYTFSKTPGPSRGQAGPFYENSSLAQRQSILDVFYGPRSTCVLMKEILLCSAGPKIMQLNFEKIRPAGIISLTSEPLMLIDEAGYMYTYKKLLRNTTQLLESDFKVSPRPVQMKSYTELDFKNTYGLDRSGRLLKLRSGSNSWDPVPQAQGKTFLRSMGPYFWSPTLEKL